MGTTHADDLDNFDIDIDQLQLHNIDNHDWFENDNGDFDFVYDQYVENIISKK